MSSYTGDLKNTSQYLSIPMGGMFDKAIAAEKNGTNLFLVSSGQKKLIYYEQQIEARDIFGFTFTRVY